MAARVSADSHAARLTLVSGQLVVESSVAHQGALITGVRLGR